MKNIAKQYEDLKEGKMSRDNFVRNCRQQFPQWISPVTSINDAISILKSKRIIGEMQHFQNPQQLHADLENEGYEANHEGYSLEDNPYTGIEAKLWKAGWMEAETEKQMAHDEDTYNRETGGYGDLYKESLNEAEKSAGNWEKATGKEEYSRFKDMDNVNYTTFLRAVAFEVQNSEVVTDEDLPSILEKVTKRMKKDPNAYRELVVTNYAEIAKQDEAMKMVPVKDKNHTDEDNGMEKIKGQEAPKATPSSKKENKKGKPQGVKEMGMTPKKAKGISSTMEVPGKEKVISTLKESLKKSLTEDTHVRYSTGQEVETPDGTGIIQDIIGGTITVQLQNGQLADYQINILDKQGEKKSFSAWDKLQAYSPKVNSWLSAQAGKLDESKTEQTLRSTKPGDKIQLVLDDDTVVTMIRVGDNKNGEPTFKAIEKGKPVGTASTLSVPHIKSAKTIKEDITGSSDEAAFRDLVRKYDWYYEMSDDHQAYNRAKRVNAELKQLAKKIGEDQAVQIFNAAAPQNRKIMSMNDLQSGFMEEDKYGKLKEYLKNIVKKEAKKFKAGGETIFKNDSDATSYEAELKKAGVKYTVTSAS